MAEPGKYSKTTLTFNEDMPLEGNLSFSYGFGEVVETWVERRFGPNQVTTGEPTETPGERSAINFLEAVRLDYEGLFSFSQEGNQVVIHGNYPEIQFGDLTVFPPILTWEPENPDPQLLFHIMETSFSSASPSNPCTLVKVTVETNMLATKVTSPVQIDNNTDNPFSFLANRATGIIIQCEAADGQTTSKGLNLPGILSADNINLNISVHPDGSTVIIDSGNPFGLELEYSLDDSNWHPSSIYIFSGLPAGNYTLYVRDQFGCKVSKSFFIDAFGIDDPYFYISKSNSIQFAQRVSWGNCSDYKNDENTLSCETDVPLPYTEIQQFQNCDSITTQFRSNFSAVGGNVEVGSVTIGLTVNKVSNNMRLKDRRDATIYNLGDGKSGIFFTAGDVFDYDLGTKIGEYTLNGLLPEWGKVGNYVKVSGAWFEIENIIFDELKNAEVLVISRDTGGTWGFEARCLYNLFNYEVYEFTIDMSQYTDQTIRTSINMSDPNFGSIELHSELIHVQNRHLNTLEIRYKNKTNTDIFYATGIENKLRLPIERIDGKPSDESEVHKTDTSAILLSSEIHETNVFEFQPVTKQMMWKLVQALSHSDVLLDDVGYVKESVEVEGALEETNLYVVKATMIRAKGAFSESGEGLNISQTNVEIPGLVDFGNGFVELG